jgi:hypothetical protein
MKRLIILILFFFGWISLLFSQEREEIIVQVKIVDNDTLITATLPEILVTARLPHHFKSDFKKNSRLVYNVKKAYPYAKLAGIKFREYETILLNAEDDEIRKKLMKDAEDELRNEFEDDIRMLTFKQGIILIKLVDRETGNSSYALIQELRGKFTAFFWQTFARLFGFNLKTEYDPAGEDKDIEDIVVMIENGQI